MKGLVGWRIWHCNAQTNRRSPTLPSPSANRCFSRHPNDLGDIQRWTLRQTLLHIHFYIFLNTCKCITNTVLCFCPSEDDTSDKQTLLLFLIACGFFLIKILRSTHLNLISCTSLKVTTRTAQCNDGKRPHPQSQMGPLRGSW